MTQQERRVYLITELLKEFGEYGRIEIPEDEAGQKRLLRALFNLRMPGEAGEEFLEVQDEYLREETRGKGITDIDSLKPVEPGIYLWRGDITTLRCDAVVNAANAAMLGCFRANHSCIDNAIHTFSGVQLRLACDRIMKGRKAKTGSVMITPAFNLPSRYVIHTVGPVVSGSLTEEECGLLEKCYRSCIELADSYGLDSIAFCCISTGVFRFPGQKAAEIAVRTVRSHKSRTGSRIKVIFNVFKEEDRLFYEKQLESV